MQSKMNEKKNGYYSRIDKLPKINQEKSRLRWSAGNSGESFAHSKNGNIETTRFPKNLSTEREAGKNLQGFKSTMHFKIP